MRIVQIIIASLVVAAGLLGALLLAAFGFVIFLLRRLFGQSAAPPRFQRPLRPAPPRPTPAGRDDVIDI